MHGRLSMTGVTIDATITMSQNEGVTRSKVDKETRAQVAKVSHGLMMEARHVWSAIDNQYVLDSFMSEFDL